ncbi:MAG TPA: tetratricopeptide repeat protein [Ktedonobacteraceae bacterium]
MTRSRLPTVREDRLFWPDDAETSFAPVGVGTNAWYDWLANASIQSFSFQSQRGTFTARRERKRHGWYWYAYRKRGGKLYKAYLGRHEDMTLERLNAAAETLISGSSKHSDIAASEQPGRVSGNNLPVQLTSFIGREREVAAASALLRQSGVRLLTLTGTGGVGKTRLGLQMASELADDFAGSVCFVSLAPISDPQLVLPAIAQALELSNAGDQPYLERLVTFLSERHLLLFLDNFEQVIDAAPRLGELLARCPALKILITSREMLHVRGEQVLPVPPLALPTLSPLSDPRPEDVSQCEAVALFLHRVRAVQPDFQITPDNARTITAICAQLDGLPLAIELAAARLNLLGPQALLARLEHRLALLTRGPRDLPARQQTLRDTLQWSYDLLDAREQRLFRRLAVFVGGCALEAAEAICGEPGESVITVLDGLNSLLDKNLLQRQSAQGNEGPRFVMLETIREHGLESLATSGELEALRQAHAHYCLRLAEEADLQPGNPKQREGLERLEREHDNLRAAMRWMLERDETGEDAANRSEMALRFGVALRAFWVIHGHWHEGRTFLEQALAISVGTETPTRAKALVAAASLAVYQIDYERGETLCREGLALCRKYGDRAGAAFSLHLLGSLAWQQGNFAPAQALMEESLALYREIGDKNGIAFSLSDLAAMATPQGEYARAQALLEESLALDRELGTARNRAISLTSLALTLFVSQGDSTRVRSLLEESLALSRSLDDKALTARTLSHSALVVLHQGDAGTARRLAGESVALHRETGDRWGNSWALAILARVEAAQGGHAVALALYEESITLAWKTGSKLNIALCLEGIAGEWVAQGEPEQAVRLWGAVEALREGMGAPIWPIERAGYERSLAAAREQIGEPAFAALWAEGRSTSLEHIGLDQQSLSLLLPAHTSPAFPPAKKISPISYAGLTARELDVLRLLAQGLTSAQIAQRLVIALVTVNSHVRSIYNKLGVTSRSEESPLEFPQF